MNSAIAVPQPDLAAPETAGDEGPAGAPALDASTETGGLLIEDLTERYWPVLPAGICICTAAGR